MARKKKKNLRKAQYGGGPNQISGITGMINLGDSTNTGKFDLSKEIFSKLDQIKNLSNDSSRVVIHENPDINRKQSQDYIKNVFDIIKEQHKIKTVIPSKKLKLLTKKKGGAVGPNGVL
jgi:hypothetical protein